MTEHVPNPVGGERKVGILLAADDWRELASWAEDGAAAASSESWESLGPLLHHLRSAADSVDPPPPPKPAKPAVRYLLLPGHVTSRTDGQRHWVGSGELIRLYGVDPRECVSADPRHPRADTAIARLIDSGLIPLTPRWDGHYAIPSR